MPITFSGCSTNEKLIFEKAAENEELNIKDKMENFMKDKYGENISILSMTRQAGISYMDGYGYWAEARVDETGDEFEVYADYLGRKIEDDYAKIIYDDMIKKKVTELIEAYTQCSQYSYDIIYVPTTQMFKNPEQLDEYLEQTETYIDAEFQIAQRDPEQVAQEMYCLAQAFSDQHIHFAFELKYKDASIIGNDSENSVFMSLDKLLDRIKLM